MKIAYAQLYHYVLPPRHRFPMAKYDLLPLQLIREGTASEADFFAPTMLSDADLLLTHDADYVDRLRQLSLTRKEVRAIGFPLSLKLVKRGLHIAQGTLDCARHAMREGVALNIAGGTHHSFAARGEGFCVFNDIAIAANVLLRDGDIQRALVVDMDVHQGNGTASIFAAEPRVFTFSMHGERNYPLRKEPSDLDIGMPDKSGDDAYLSQLTAALPKLLDEFRPDLVFYLSGVDVLAADKLGRLSLTPQGCRQRDRFVFEQCHRRGLPAAVSMGGGYSDRLAIIIDAHAATFQEAKRAYE